jgi:hypothetical protein
MNDAKRCKSLNRNVADGKRQSESLKSCADNCRPSERRENRLRRSRRSRRGLIPTLCYGRVSGGRAEALVEGGVLSDAISYAPGLTADI